MSTAGTDQASAALAAGSKSFTLAARLLPPRLRVDAAVCYAYCRRADDLVDLGSPDGTGTTTEDPAVAVARLRSELDDLYAGVPPADPMLAAFQELLLRRQIPRAYPEALLDGLAMDARATRFDSFATLDLYCFRVAGAVGLMMCHVLGLAERRALPRAAHLGMGMQLTNICRDVVEDWRRGRVYIPEPIRPSDEQPLDRAGPGLDGAVRVLLDRAAKFYRSGRLGLLDLDWRSAFAIRVAASVYAEIGAVLARRGFDPTGGRAVVSTPRKLWLVVRSALASALEVPTRLARAGRRRLTPFTTALPPLRYPDDLPLPD
jgi:phytoene synthase